MSKTEYQETLASYRHYSNLRFAFTTLFVTITAGLVVGIFGNKIEITEKWVIVCLKSAGFFVTALFLYLEYLTSKYLLAMEEHLKTIYPDCHLLKFPNFTKSYTSYFFRTLYVGLLLFWMFSLFKNQLLSAYQLWFS